MNCRDCKHCVPLVTAVSAPNGPLSAADRFGKFLTADQSGYLSSRGNCHRYPPLAGGFPLVNMDEDFCSESL